MLSRKPTKPAHERAIANWDLTKRLIFETFHAFWKRVTAHLPMPGTEAGDEASYCEWTEGFDTYQGMRNAAGLKSGIVRKIDSTGWINEATYFENKKHGLCFWWINGYDYAFRAYILEHGEQKACIQWKSDWSEYHSSGNKALILENGGLSLLKP